MDLQLPKNPSPHRHPPAGSPSRQIEKTDHVNSRCGQLAQRIEIIDKNSPWGGLNIQKRKWCVKEILA
jgi:hypothetical protein